MGQYICAIPQIQIDDINTGSTKISFKTEANIPEIQTGVKFLLNQLAPKVHAGKLTQLVCNGVNNEIYQMEVSVIVTKIT